MAWEPTHYFKDDGSTVRFITDDPPATPGYFIVENEDGEVFQTLADEVEEMPACQCRPGIRCQLHVLP